MSYTDSTLRIIYSWALDFTKQLDQLAANTVEFHRLLGKALDSLRECRVLSDSLGLFSPNETIEDIMTGDIQYLNIDFRLAELLGRSPVIGPQQRLDNLRKAQEAYARFLDRLESYELLSVQDKRLHERWQADRNNFELVASNDPNARRGAKIQRYQQEKQLKEKLEYLRSQSQSTNDDDDSPHRELYLAELGFNTLKAFQSLDSITQELKILALAPIDAPAHAPPTSDSDARQRQVDGAAYSDKLDTSLGNMLNGGGKGPLLNSKGRPLQPFVLHDNRSKMRDGVFRSGHRLPTMTIEEYLDAEKARGGIIEGGGESSGIPKQIDEDDFEAADRETEKQRAWDEFKEANPKGSGNTLNRG